MLPGFWQLRQVIPVGRIWWKKYTTLCEFWTLKQSHNHVMMGSIDAWFYKNLAGIYTDEANPGFEKVIIRPYIPESLNFARASIETIKGRVESGWEKFENEFSMFVRIPFNTIADIYIPATDKSMVYENGQPVSTSDALKFLRQEAEYQVVSVKSGIYDFKVRLDNK